MSSTLLCKYSLTLRKGRKKPAKSSKGNKKLASNVFTSTKPSCFSTMTSLVLNSIILENLAESILFYFFFLLYCKLQWLVMELQVVKCLKKIGTNYIFLKTILHY